MTPESKGMRPFDESKWATDTLIGHATPVDLLRRAMRTGRLAHAYLFVGPEHVGKSAVAMRLASVLLDVADPTTHPDFFLVERQKDPKTGKPHAGIVLEQVQALTGRLALGAFMGGWKVCVLDGAHALNKESANALLKTLEEPHPRTVLVLTATAAEHVLPTIRSRCQVIRFGRVATPVIVDALEARGSVRGAAELRARLADGRPGRALAFAADPSVLDAVFSLRDELLRFSETSIAERWKVIERTIPPKLSFQESGDRARAFLDVAAEVLRDVLLIAAGSPDRIVHVDVRDRLQAWADGRGAAGAAAALQALAEARKRLDDNVNPRATLEHFALAF